MYSVIRSRKVCESIPEDGVDVVAVAYDDGGSDEQGEAAGDEQLGAEAGSVPLLSARPHRVAKMMMLAMWRVQEEKSYLPILVWPME